MQPPGGGAPLCSSRRPASIIVPKISIGNACNKLEHFDLAAQYCLRKIVLVSSATGCLQLQGLPWGGRGNNTPITEATHTFGGGAGRAGALRELRHIVAARAALVFVLRAIGAHRSETLDAGAAAAGHRRAGCCGAGRYRAGWRLQPATRRICRTAAVLHLDQPSCSLAQAGTGVIATRHNAEVAHHNSRLRRCCRQLKHADSSLLKYRDTAVTPVPAAAAACGGVPLHMPFLATVSPSHSAWHLWNGIWCQQQMKAVVVWSVHRSSCGST